MKKKLFLVVIDAVVFAASFALAAQWFEVSADRYWLYLTLFTATKAFFLAKSGLYNAILRYAGLPLASQIIKSISYACLLSFFIIHFPMPQKIPVGFFATDFLVSTFLVGFIRFAPRYFRESLPKDWGSKRLLIYGAGGLGETVARKFLSIPGEYRLVGFVDDSPEKIGKRLHNLPVFGPSAELGAILAKKRISELIIAISSLPGQTVRDITRECRRHGVYCRIVPSLTDMLKKDVSIKNIDIADLLKRDPKDLDEAQIRRFLAGKTIMISGAGGSIGSELSRQCVRYGAKKLVLIDHSEFNLYSLQEELAASGIPLRFSLLNILNGLEKIMAEEKPEIFFHAAAYKHVPIVEENPGDGVINNVGGTIQAAQLAEKYGVHKFVLISTDKAVRPTSVMGASKRVAELYVQNLDSHSKTEYVAVRFGNVLGSSGSVIPKFLEQINKGGPVTVTHPEVTRYFMLTSEAVQLVLQAASIGNGGEIFILNMGHPVRIAEMAEDLIFLSGREPHKDIKIEFTGLRPGEKLYEELLVDETEKKTQYENITIARPSHVNWERLNEQVENLLQSARAGQNAHILTALKRIIPEFMHESLKPETRKDVIPFRRSI